MTKREKLLEQYEEALFALMMDEFAEHEGREALKENERLKLDPTFVVPPNLQHRCRKTISHYFAKRGLRRAGSIFSKMISKVAIVALMGTLLFTTVFAVSSDFRVKTLNWVIDVFDDRTEFSFGGQSSTDIKEISNQKIVTEWLPEGYSLYNQKENKFGMRMDYRATNGEEFSIAVFKGLNTKLGIDTEDAEVESIDIQGDMAFMVSKDGITQITWASEKLQIYFIIDGPESIKEDLINVAQGIKIIK